MRSEMHSLLDRAIGKSLTAVRGIYAHGGRYTLLAVTFEIGDLVVTLSADPNTDAICAAAGTGHNVGHGENTLVRTVEEFEPFIGSSLCGVWLCYDEPGHCDSVDLAFGDLVRPNIKVLCVASELLLLPVGHERTRN